MTNDNPACEVLRDIAIVLLVLALVGACSLILWAVLGVVAPRLFEAFEAVRFAP